MNEIEFLQATLVALAKHGRHAKLKLYPNGTGIITDGHGRQKFQFSSLEELIEYVEAENQNCSGD